MAEWTVMVYMNAKNDLDRYALSNINLMEKVGSTDQVKIAVELGRLAIHDLSEGGWKGQRRYVIQKDNDPDHVTSPVLQAMPKADMGDWHHLVDFVAWAKQAAPAHHYMLIVWSHGTGWEFAPPSEGVWVKGISFDAGTFHRINTPDLGKAMAAIGKVDVYASDACLMQMTEVAYQIKDHADYIVGSEAVEPDDGYAYDAFLGALTARPDMSAEGLAKAAVNSFGARYAATGKNATLSAIAAARLPELLSQLDSWSQAVMAAGEKKVVSDAHSRVQHYVISGHKDLLHFVQLVDTGSQNAAVRSQGANLEDFLAHRLIVATTAVGGDEAHSQGLAVYLPEYIFLPSYDKLAWSQDGSWMKFAKWVKGL